MAEPFLVSIHIPKTAGTSLALVLDRCLGRRIIYDYQDYDQPQKASAEIRNNVAFIRSYFDALHGHFLGSKYFDLFPGAAFIATLRHPVNRVISHFFHELNEASSTSWYHNDIASGKMDIVEFSAQVGVGDAMTKHLAGRNLRDYAMLIISEQFAASCKLLSYTVRHLDIDGHFGVPPCLPILNTAADRPVLHEVGQALRQAIFARTNQDNDTYAEANALFLERIARLP